MPTYEYVCKSCGENIEVFQSFSARPLRKHVECGGELQKVFHARGVMFKGSGFYKTDSRVAKADSNGKSDSAKTDSKKAENGASDTKKAPSGATEDSSGKPSQD